MIEYLMSNPDLTIEIEENALAVSFSSRLAPERHRAEFESTPHRQVADAGLSVSM